MAKPKRFQKKKTVSRSDARSYAQQLNADLRGGRKRGGRKGAREYEKSMAAYIRLMR